MKPDFKELDKKIEQLANTLAAAKITTQASPADLASVRTDFKKVLAGGYRAVIPYQKLRNAAAQQKKETDVRASTSTGFSNVSFLDGLQVRQDFREYVQNYVTLVDYSNAQRIYFDAITALNKAYGPVAEGAVKPLDAMSVSSTNAVTIKVGGHIWFTQEFLRFGQDREDFVLAQAAANIEAEIHHHVMSTINAAAPAPTYPGAGNFTNTPNTFSLAQFLYSLLKRYPLVWRKMRSPVYSIWYPTTRYDSMFSQTSPLTGLPIADDYLAIIEKHAPDLVILPHDILTPPLDVRFVAIDGTRVFVSISDIQFERMPRTISGTAGTAVLPANMEMIAYDAFVNVIVLPATTLIINGTTYPSIPSVFADSVANGLANI